MDDWSNIAYLQSGTARQRDAYRALVDSDILIVLGDYDPILVGALPLGLETPAMQLTLVCQANDTERFAQEMTAYYGDAPGFEIASPGPADVPVAADSTTCHFLQEGFVIEVTASSTPTQEQAALRILNVEARLLRVGGDDARRAIQNRMFGEQSLHQAFAAHFHLGQPAPEGDIGSRRNDPVQSLLALSDATYPELEEVVIRAAHNRAPYSLDLPVR